MKAKITFLITFGILAQINKKFKLRKRKEDG